MVTAVTAYSLLSPIFGTPKTLLSRMRYWYILDVNPDGHSLVTLEQLLTWGNCQQWKDLPAGLRRAFQHKGSAHTHTHTLSLSLALSLSLSRSLSLSLSLSLYIYIDRYLCIHTYVCVCMYIYIYIYICIYERMLCLFVCPVRHQAIMEKQVLLRAYCGLMFSAPGWGSRPLLPGIVCYEPRQI